MIVTTSQEVTVACDTQIVTYKRSFLSLYPFFLRESWLSQTKEWDNSTVKMTPVLAITTVGICCSRVDVDGQVKQFGRGADKKP